MIIYVGVFCRQEEIGVIKNDNMFILHGEKMKWWGACVSVFDVYYLPGWLCFFPVLIVSDQKRLKIKLT